MSIPQRSKLFHSLRQWKTKAISRREQIEALKKRIGELILSRDTWRGKAQVHHDKVAALQAKVNGLRAEVATLQADITEFQAELSTLRAQVADLQEQNRRSESPVNGSEKKRARSLSA